MVDTLGWRKVFGVVTPSTNTVVQPESSGSSAQLKPDSEER
jgi:hypothetical protein